ncbi:MAG: hypothetical protein AAGF20_00105 [Pseudomonadota bacterium]
MTDTSLPLPPEAKSQPAEARAESSVADKPKRARRPRKEAVKRARRRRGENDQTMGMKLEVTFEKDPAYEYRWINEGVDGQRLFDKTKRDDWDVVSKDGEPSDNVGSAVRRAVGGTNSDPIYAYLCRKPKDLFDEDYLRKQEHNNKLMSAIREGQAPVPAGKGLTEADNVHGEGIQTRGRL